MCMYVFLNSFSVILINGQLFSGSVLLKGNQMSAEIVMVFFSHLLRLYGTSGNLFFWMPNFVDFIIQIPSHTMS